MTNRPAFRYAAALGVVALLGLAAGPRSESFAQEGNLYWVDALSVCEDPCPSLLVHSCKCVKLPPLIVVG
jgi:hypothetical protein